MIRTMGFCFFFIFALVTLKAPAGLANDTPFDNEEVIGYETGRLLSEVVLQQAALSPDGLRQPLFLRMDAPAGVQNRIITQLKNNDIRVSGREEGRQSLHVQWESHNRLVEKPDSSRRELAVKTVVMWESEAGEILQTWQFAFSYSDWISTSRINDHAGAWEHARFHETRQIHRRSYRKRIAEPALIIGAAATTIYLLYNIRS